MGGNRDQWTVPNFLMNYGPDGKNVQGGAVGNSAPLDAIKWKNGVVQPFDPHVTHLLGAQSQARIEDAVNQTLYIVNELKTTYAKTVNLQNDWKLFTFFIGANNVGGACHQRDYSKPEWYEKYMNEILTIVSTQIPRVRVNVVKLFNISQVWDIHETSSYCKFAWSDIVKTEMGCLMDGNLADRKAIDGAVMKNNEVIDRVVAQWQAKNIKDFAITVQPFLENLKVLGLEYLSEFDCFHPSYITDAAFAIQYWNSMMLPPGQKPTTITANVQVICPTANTFLQ